MKKHTDNSLVSGPDYHDFIEALKARVTSARLTAARAITHEAILLYWDIGQGVVEKQRELGWGDSVVEMIAADLRRAFPGAKGFSPQNLWRMQQLYLLHTQPEFLAQVVREMENESKRLPNGECAVTDKKTHNFDLALPEHFAEQADEILKIQFYLNLLNDQERAPDDQPSIGIILCAEKDDVEVEYALRTKTNPHRRRRLPTPNETARRTQRQTPHRQTTRNSAAPCPRSCPPWKTSRSSKPKQGRLSKNQNHERPSEIPSHFLPL